MTATLGNDFEDKLATATLDVAEHELAGKPDNLIHQAIQQSHEALRDFSGEYDVESIIDSLVLTEVERTDDSITIRWGWEHPAAPYFEWGTSDHVVNGQPVLSFVWEDPPAEIRQEFDQARTSGGQFTSGWRVFFSSVEVDGIDETRFVRIGLRWLELNLGRTVSR